MDIASTPRQLMWLRFRRHRFASISALFLLALGLAALAAPLWARIAGIDIDEVDLFNRLQGPSAQHWLGTDDLGRDLLLRLLHGGRVSLAVALVAAAVAAVIGALVGVVAGYFGGGFDAILMRVTDGVIALPILPLLIVLAAVDFSKLGVPPDLVQSQSASLYKIVLIVALFGWTTAARLVRGMTLSLKTRDFVRAAQALGARPWRIMSRHILPNAASPLIVATTMSAGSIILFESVLSFLGLGIQPPNASWGNMLTNAQELINSAPMLAVWPGLMIFLTVIAFNFVGDGLQEALDPRALESRAAEG